MVLSHWTIKLTNKSEQIQWNPRGWLNVFSSSRWRETPFVKGLRKLLYTLLKPFHTENESNPTGFRSRCLVFPNRGRKCCKWFVYNRKGKNMQVKHILEKWQRNDLNLWGFVFNDWPTKFTYVDKSAWEQSRSETAAYDQSNPDVGFITVQWVKVTLCLLWSLFLVRSVIVCRARSLQVAVWRDNTSSSPPVERLLCTPQL